MTNKTLKELYGGEIKIEFFPDSHRYKMVGERTYLISVTACTGVIDKSRFLIPWAVNLAGSHLRQYLENGSGNKFTSEELLPVIEEACKQHQIKKEEAASIGGEVHAWVEAFARAKQLGEPIPELNDEMNEKVISGISAFLDWYNGHEIKFLETEKMIYSKKNCYVGLTDAVAMVDGKKTIIDYKTGKGVYNEFYYQLSAYWAAYEEELGPLDQAMIIHFDKETGEFKSYILTREDHEKNYPVFLSCLTIKQREKELSKYGD